MSQTMPPNPMAFQVVAIFFLERPYSGVSSPASSQKCVFTYQTRNMLMWIPPKMGEIGRNLGICRIAAILNTIFTTQQSTKGSVKISSPIGV